MDYRWRIDGGLMDYRWMIIRGKVVVRRSEKRKVKSEEFKFVLQFKAVY